MDRTALLVFLTLALLDAISVLLLPPGFDHTLNSLHLGNLRDAFIFNRVGRDRLSSPTGVYVNVLVPIPTINVLLYLNELGVNRFLRLVHLTINCTVDLILVTDCVLDLIFVHLPGRLHTDWALIFMAASLSHQYRVFLLWDVLLDLFNLRGPQVRRVKLLWLIKVHLGSLILVHKIRPHRGKPLDVHKVGNHWLGRVYP